ncbi:MAG: enoyl-CoA hydratase/isomerase family protein [Proteobacteria bacterium]|jgi:enoyl-CoA hydratase|nr:enoyl-CoA hydratase/isomerase family protein [Pseudomonadota bacterium]
MSAVLMEIKGKVATLTINRPEALNAINMDVLKGLHDSLLEVSRNNSVSIIKVTGSGEKAFVAGADIAGMKNMSPVEAEEFAAYGQRTFRMLETSKKITVAVVQGFALGGGCELAMACDLIYASAKAKFGQPEVNLGVIPGFGGTQRLSRLVGIQKARELIYTGRIICADEAKTIGLVAQVFASEELENEIAKLIEELSAKGPYALSQAKAALRLGQDMDLNRACQIEKELFAMCFSHADQKEGMTAFLEKRKPNWK